LVVFGLQPWDFFKQIIEITLIIENCWGKENDTLFGYQLSEINLKTRTPQIKRRIS